MKVARPCLRIALLGQPQLQWDGAPWAFRAPSRSLSLLVYLLLHMDETSTRDNIALTFWPDLLPPDGRAKTARIPPVFAWGVTGGDIDAMDFGRQSDATMEPGIFDLVGMSPSSSDLPPTRSQLRTRLKSTAVILPIVSTMSGCRARVNGCANCRVACCGSLSNQGAGETSLAAR